MSQRFSICNELLSNTDINRSFEIVSELGYRGIEIAPFTISDDVRKISRKDREALRGLAASNGLEIVGIHWVLVSPAGLHLTHSDASTRERTKNYMADLIAFTADIGGHVIVLGSPKQRSISKNVRKEDAWVFAKQILRYCCEEAERLDVLLCLEPLSRSLTNFINTAEEAMRMIEDVGLPNMRMTLDVYSMSDEEKSMHEIITRSAPFLAHFHANDTNGKAPGMGNADYDSIARALKDIDYKGFVSVEIFDRPRDPIETASESIRNLRTCFWGGSR